MSNIAELIRNRVHPNRILELWMGEPEPGSGNLKANWGNKRPPKPAGGYIDTRKPPGGRPFREKTVTLLRGQRLPVWVAYVANGPRVTLLYAIKHPDRKPEVIEMDRNAASLLVHSFPALRQNKPTMVVPMPSGSWQAQHFAEEVAKAAELPLKTGVFKKIGSIKGIFHAEKQAWARANITLADRTQNFEGQSIALVDDNVGSGFSIGAAAELLYARGAAYVIGLATFKIAGAKDPDIEDVPLGLAKGVNAPEEEAQPDETEDDEDEDTPTTKNPKEKGELLRRVLVENQESLPAFTVKELAELYEVGEIEMRFTLSQLGLAKLVKPG